MQCVVFEKISNSYLLQIAREIMLLLFINAKDKTLQRVKTDVNFGSAHALFVICTRVTRECTRFQPIRRTQYFMYIVIIDTIPLLYYF